MDMPNHDSSGDAAACDSPTPATRQALIRLLNSGTWKGAIARWGCPSDTFRRSASAVDVIVAIPACNESSRITSCLDACAHAALLSGLGVRLVLLVNGTRDDTIERALAWSLRRRRALTIVDVDFAPALAHAGAARRLALEIASLGASPDTMLMTTDADARPGPAWIAANADRLDTENMLVCGRVSLDPDEATRLSPRVKAVGEIEGRYKRATLELEHRLDPDPWNPWPHHGMASGASLAIRAGDLATLGGVPLVACGEDRALARAARAHGMPVVHADEIVVEVSCRMAGRATGGMADALHQRDRDPDPPCDEALEPAATLHARLLARARTRASWSSRETRHEALVALGVDEASATAIAAIDGFDRAWERVERVRYLPGRARLRTGDLRRELPTLLALLDDTDTGRGRVAVDEAPVRSVTRYLSSPERLSDAPMANVVPLGEGTP